uniref:Uncharacterized protein n=1 Tax=Oryza glumipatula TaxID=40148 RepID=A0A0D9Y3Q8_9ORYZ
MCDGSGAVASMRLDARRRWRQQPRCATAAAAAASLFLLSAVNFVDGGGSGGLSFLPFCCEFC